MKEINLNFEGYWRDCNKSGLPTYSGVYLVYRCFYNHRADTVSLVDIIYIGKAANINKRHENHEKYEMFLSCLQQGEELCYSCATVENNLEEVENALIFAQKPLLNDQGKFEFNYPKVHVVASGSCACIKYDNFYIGNN